MHEYILPAKFDNTNIPGVLETTGYIDLRTKTPYELAKLIISKLNMQVENRWFGLWEGRSTVLSRYSACRITNVTNNSFDFNIVNVVGSHIGEITGNAKILSNTYAEFIDEDTTINKDGKCVLGFTMFNDVIQISQSEQCKIYGGTRIYFAGNYAIEKDFFWDYLKLEDEILSNLYEALHKEKYWQIFLLRLSNVSGIDNLDNFDAVAYESGVGSMYGIWECMFMYATATKHVYGAFIDDDSNICYFSSDEKYFSTQPETVKHWIDSFAGKKVINIQEDIRKTPSVKDALESISEEMCKIAKDCIDDQERIAAVSVFLKSKMEEIIAAKH